MSANICFDRRGPVESETFEGTPGLGVDCLDDAGVPVDLNEADAGDLAAAAKTSGGTEGAEVEISVAMAESVVSVVG